MLYFLSVLQSLLGTFSCTGSPGDFTWQKGVLTKVHSICVPGECVPMSPSSYHMYVCMYLHCMSVCMQAVEAGMWVIFEDIDSAPSDVVS